MYLADTCKWLFAHGASNDIKRKPGSGLEGRARRPLYTTIRYGLPFYQSLRKWFILNGALCKDDASGELDVEIMERDIAVNPSSWRAKERKDLLEWANNIHRARTSFLPFLSGTSSDTKHAYSTRRSSSPVSLLNGKSGVLELIGNYTGIVRGRKARITRQLTELLPDLFDSTWSDGEPW